MHCRLPKTKGWVQGKTLEGFSNQWLEHFVLTFGAEDGQFGFEKGFLALGIFESSFSSRDALAGVFASGDDFSLKPWP